MVDGVVSKKSSSLGFRLVILWMLFPLWASLKIIFITRSPYSKGNTNLCIYKRLHVCVCERKLVAKVIVIVIF